MERKMSVRTIHATPAARFGKRALTGSICAIAAMTALAAPSNADESADDGPYRGIPGNYTGSGISTGDFTMTKKAKEKDALAENFAAFREGKLSAAEVEAAERKFQREHGGGESFDAAALRDPVPSSKTLAFSHRAQSKSYYCGPASGVMFVITAAGGRKPASKFNGISLSQANMGSPSHMHTDYYGATNWSTGRFITGVNRWRGNSFYDQVGNPTGGKLTTYLTRNVNLYHIPIAANTVELAFDDHYNHHPRNQKIGHWIMAYGFTDYGGRARWADPSTSVWSDVNETFTYGNTLFADRFLNINGVVV